MSNRCFDDADCAEIHRVVQEARQRQRQIEDQRRREGGIYDEILGRWVPASAAPPREPITETR